MLRYISKIFSSSLFKYAGVFTAVVLGVLTLINKYNNLSDKIRDCEIRKANITKELSMCKETVKNQAEKYKMQEAVMREIQYRQRELDNFKHEAIETVEKEVVKQKRESDNKGSYTIVGAESESNNSK